MNNQSELEGPAAQATSIRVYAIGGEFSVRGSAISVKYASTFANSTRKDGHHDLLSQLRTMRERTDATELGDLQSLLQRDLNDARVAHDLIPYLEGGAQLGFFPAVLAVLMPRGYLKKQSDQPPPAYPVPTTGENGLTSYGNAWSFRNYAIDKTTTPLGLLEINPRETDVVVLDGQHRAVAFRYASKDFDPSDIHQCFYEHIPIATPLSADLPVTLIWFESENGVRPEQISRRLFVDVNNNAKPVSDARTILLDDRSASAVVTQEFYNLSAENGFEPGIFSLLHGAFDIDAELTNAKLPNTCLTAPAIIHDAAQWSMFGSSTFDNLSTWRIQRLRTQQTLAKLENWLPACARELLTSNDDDVSRGVLLKSEADILEFRTTVRTHVAPILMKLYRDWNVIQAHYKAGEHTRNWALKEEGVTYAEVWQRVIAGGEGLYMSLREARPSERVKNYLKALENIENRLSSTRSSQYYPGAIPQRVDAIYRSIRTKAFVVGYVMAVDYVAALDTEGDRVTAAEKLVEKMNERNEAQWQGILLDLRAELLGTGADPRSWPAYRNILVRIYDGDSCRIYSGPADPNAPEFRLVDMKLRARAEDIYKSNDEKPRAGVVRRQAKAVMSDSEELLKNTGFHYDWLRDTTTQRELGDKLVQMVDEQYEDE